MRKMNEIVEMLTNCDCDPESIKEIVRDLITVTKGNGKLPVGIAVAIYLKILAGQLCDDNDEQTNLGVLLDLTSVYDVGIHRK